MKEVIKKEILQDLNKTIEILEHRDDKDFEKIQQLSEHATDDVAAYKDLDLISITVLLYSIYKIMPNMLDEDYQDLLAELKFAVKHLKAGNFSRYNKSIKSLFRIVTKCNAKVKVHLQDVMHAARIKKGASLLSKGLSIGQAAGLMGLSNWDLQQYIGKIPYAEQNKFRTSSAKKRLINALQLFGAK
jgi:hypothetical protein